MRFSLGLAAQDKASGGWAVIIIIIIITIGCASCPIQPRTCCFSLQRGGAVGWGDGRALDAIQHVRALLLPQKIGERELEFPHVLVKWCRVVVQATSGDGVGDGVDDGVGDGVGEKDGDGVGEKDGDGVGAGLSDGVIGTLVTASKAASVTASVTACGIGDDVGDGAGDGGGGGVGENDGDGVGASVI